jgi:hypothetical protein
VVEEARAAKVKVENKEAEKVQAANEAIKEGLLAIEADKKKAAAEAVRLNAVDFVKHWQEPCQAWGTSRGPIDAGT